MSQIFLKLFHHSRAMISFYVMHNLPSIKIKQSDWQTSWQHLKVFFRRLCALFSMQHTWCQVRWRSKNSSNSFIYQFTSCQQIINWKIELNHWKSTYIPAQAKGNVLQKKHEWHDSDALNWMMTIHMTVQCQQIIWLQLMFCLFGVQKGSN